MDAPNETELLKREGGATLYLGHYSKTEVAKRNNLPAPIAAIQRVSTFGFTLKMISEGFIKEQIDNSKGQKNRRTFSFHDTNLLQILDRIPVKKRSETVEKILKSFFFERKGGSK